MGRFATTLGAKSATRNLLTNEGCRTIFVNRARRGRCRGWHVATLLVRNLFAARTVTVGLSPR